MREMHWNVYVEDINGKQMKKYDIFEHYGFAQDVKDAYKKHKDDFENFKEAVRQSLSYFFWAKCEWEIVLSPWPESNRFHEKKIDVYDQVRMNWDVFIKYVWDMAHARKKREAKREAGKE